MKTPPTTTTIRTAGFLLMSAAAALSATAAEEPAATPPAAQATPQPAPTPAPQDAPAAQTAQAEEAPAETPVTPEEMERLNEFIMHYAERPDPEQLGAYLARWDVYFPTAQRSMLPFIVTFFGEVFKANPDRVEDWMKTISTLSEDWQRVFEMSLAFSRGEMEDFTKNEFASPELLDASWGGFSASGDKKYAEFVLRTACADEAPNELNLTVRAAAWSCSSFIKTHSSMREIARAWFAAATEQQRLNFAGRTSAEIQQEIFGKVLVDPDAPSDDAPNDDAAAAVEEPSPEAAPTDAPEPAAEAGEADAQADKADATPDADPSAPAEKS